MIPYSRQSIQPSDIEAVTNVLTSPWLTQGPMVPQLEDGLTKTLREIMLSAVQWNRPNLLTHP